MNFNTKCFICVLVFIIINILYIINDEYAIKPDQFVSDSVIDNTDKLSIPSEILLDISPETGNTYIHFNLINLIYDPIDYNTKEPVTNLLSLLIRSVVNLKMSEIYQLIQVKNKNQETILDLLNKIPDNDRKESWIKMWNTYIDISTGYYNARNNYM